MLFYGVELGARGYLEFHGRLVVIHCRDGAAKAARDTGCFRTLGVPYTCCNCQGQSLTNL